MEENKSGISKVTSAVVKGTGTLVKTTKLNINLSSEESRLKNIYFDIGKLVHEIYKTGGSFGGIFDEKYGEILETEAKIAEINEKIEIAKGIVNCPKCGTSSKRGSAFCLKCGTNIGEITFEEVQAPSPTKDLVIEEMSAPIPNPPPKVEGKVCIICGLKNQIDERFCLSCGRVL
jgi:ribosomal protein L32